jgi:hypothetical protein
MSEILDFQDEMLPAKKPVFLKVLCILTYVGAGFGILGAFYAIFMHGFTIRMLEASTGIYKTNPILAQMDNSEYITAMKKWGQINNFLNLLGSLLCLTGALFMNKLKKSGFFMYIGGQILPFIGMYGLMGGLMPNSSGPLGSFVVLGQIIAIIFPLAFIIMYSVNFKHLK